MTTLSFEGAAWHARNLKLLAPDVAENLRRSLERPRLQVQVEPELPRTSPSQLGLEVESTPLASGLLAELALRACAEGHIDRQRAAEILSLQ